MSIWGEQWLCHCTWSNVFVRKVCRNCGAPQSEAVVASESPDAAMARAEAAKRPASASDDVKDDEVKQ